VKRTPYFQLRVLMLLAAVMLLLAACERPLQPDLDQDPAPPPVQIDPFPAPPDPLFPAPEILPEEEIQLPPVEEETEPSVDQPPVEEAPPTAEPPPPSQETVAPGTTVTYVVQAGDTLFRISQRYNVSMEEIIIANQLANPNRLAVGQSLIIPVGGLSVQPSTGETVHVVQAGDNLYRIGLRYGFTVSELTAYNNLANSHWIYVGQQIRIPPRN
jgi:LysM repeat protein